MHSPALRRCTFVARRSVYAPPDPSWGAPDRAAPKRQHTLAQPRAATSVYLFFRQNSGALCTFLLKTPLSRPGILLGRGRATGATRILAPSYSTTPDSNAETSRQLDKQKAFTKEMQLDITAAHSRAASSRKPAYSHRAPWRSLCRLPSTLPLRSDLARAR